MLARYDDYLTFGICHCDLVFISVALFRVVSCDFVDPFWSTQKAIHRNHTNQHQSNDKCPMSNGASASGITHLADKGSQHLQISDISSWIIVWRLENKCSVCKLAVLGHPP